MKTSWPNWNAPQKPDQEYIRRMFDGLAGRYDIFTKLTGFGQAGRWRDEALGTLRKDMRILDIACGTGDLALRAAEKTNGDADIVGLDFSENMLKVAERRFEKLGLKTQDRFRLVFKKAEELPLEGEIFDLIVSGFALRNLYENIDRILQGAYASLKPGGRVSFLDLTEPAHPFLKKIWRFYMLTFVGFYGTLLFGKKYPVPYLPDSAKRFPPPAEFQAALRRAGFGRVSAKGFLLGSVTLYQGTRE